MLPGRSGWSSFVFFPVDVTYILFTYIRTTSALRVLLLDVAALCDNELLYVALLNVALLPCCLQWPGWVGCFPTVADCTAPGASAAPLPQPQTGRYTYRMPTFLPSGVPFADPALSSVASPSDPFSCVHVQSTMTKTTTSLAQPPLWSQPLRAPKPPRALPNRKHGIFCRRRQA